MSKFDFKHYLMELGYSYVNENGSLFYRKAGDDTKIFLGESITARKNHETIKESKLIKTKKEADSFLKTLVK